MNNRLCLMRFYLVGPMDYDRNSGREWREDLSEWLFNRRAIPLNPYYKPLRDMTGVEDDDSFNQRLEAKKNKDYKKLRELAKPIVHTDLRMVDHCDANIINLDLSKRPCGTWDELFTGVNQNKPSIIHAVQGVSELPDWLFGRMPYELFFDTWEDIKSYLHYIDTAEEVDDLGGRWKFFDYEPLVRRALKLPTYVGG